MKTYKDFEKIPLGYSDIATLIVVGCCEWDKKRHSCLRIDEIHFGGDGFYEAYLVTDKDAKIGEHYEKVYECDSWLKIYDDDTRVFDSDYKYNRFEIYRAANYGMIIKCWKQ